MKTQRDTNRFYNYPPLLPRTNAEKAFSRKEIGFYIHIPFCKSVCNFCPFNRFIALPAQVSRYLSALKKEILLLSKTPQVQSTEIASFFIGGGTPTQLSKKQLTELLGFCFKKLPFSSECQATIEANPSTVSREKLFALKKAGVNRISFGVQSFDDSVLSFLGTPHNRSQALKAIKNAKSCGFSDINIDLLYRLPGQTVVQWRKELETLKKLNVSHASTYALDIAPNTSFCQMRRKNSFPSIPSFEEEKRMVKATDEILARKGFERYNTDQLARNNKFNQYGLQVALGEVVGAGLGSFSHFNGFEYRNSNRLEQYFSSIKKNSLPIELGKELTQKEQIERFLVKNIIFLSLNKAEFEQRFGISLKKLLGNKLKKLQALGLLKETASAFNVTFKGRMNIYSLCKAFYGKNYLQLMKAIEKAKKRTFSPENQSGKNLASARPT